MLKSFKPFDRTIIIGGLVSAGAFSWLACSFCLR